MEHFVCTVLVYGLALALLLFIFSLSISLGWFVSGLWISNHLTSQWAVRVYRRQLNLNN